MLRKRQQWLWCATVLTALSCSGAVEPTIGTANPAHTPTAIVISPAESELASTGMDSVQLQAKVIATDATPADSQAVHWTSLDTTMAIVDARGVVRIAPATRYGPVGITASSAVNPGIVATAVVVVGVRPELLALSPTAFGERGINNDGTLSVGEEMTLKATGTVTLQARYKYTTSENVLQHVAWVSRDPSIATIDSAGRVTARAPGVARIVATSTHRVNLSDSATVTVLPAPLRFTTVSVGGQACGLTSTGAAYCWGGNARHLGAGMLPAHIGPVRVATSVAFRAISVGGEEGTSGAHTCAIAVDDALYCWGAYPGGAKDAAGTAYQPVPARVTGGPVRYQTVSAGYSSTCALDYDGVAYCWSVFKYGPGEGPPSTPDSTVAKPAALPGGLRFTAISVGLTACGLATDSTTYCWGATPRAVPGGLHFVRVTAGGAHACGLLRDGTAYCWETAVTPLLAPQRIPGGLSFSAIYAAQAGTFTCGIATTGVYCWTYTPSAQPAIPSAVWTTPVLLPTSLRFSELGVSDHSCGLANGKVYCWGRNVYGQLGDNTDTDQPTPVPIGGQWP